MTDGEITKLEGRLAKAKSVDRRARLTDAAMHLRKAIEIVESCVEPTSSTQRLVDLLAGAADILTSEAP